MDTAVEIELPDDRDPALEQAQRLNDAAMAIVKADRCGVAAPLAMLRRAAAIVPQSPEVWSNIGLVLWRVGDIDGADYAFHHAVQLRPGDKVYHGNLGVFLGAIGRPEEAEYHLTESDRIDPDDVAAKWDISLLHLRNGDWQRGLQCYDIRRQHRGPSLYPPLPAPMWRGEDLNGKTLYVQGEQGIGDRFLFSRYLPWIKATWPDCRIMVCLHDALINIFWEFRHIVQFLPQGIPWPKDIDYGVFLCTLPELHGTTLTNVPPDPGFLLKRIQQAQAGTRCNLPLPNLPSLKVGVCWTGNPEQTRNRDRSMPLELVLPFAEDPRLILYSFQCSPGGADIARLGAGDLFCDLAPEIEAEGWVGTGLALMEMDLLVTVCTSVPHLAGALGVPCWLMLCADPYWIWAREGDTTPWYPGMRLFRQRRLGDWSPVIAEVRSELSKLADTTLAKYWRPHS